MFWGGTRKLTWLEALCVKSKVQTISPNSPLYRWETKVPRGKVTCPGYQQQTPTEPRIEVNSLFFQSCNHLTSTYWVLSPVLELRKHASTASVPLDWARRTRRNSFLGSGRKAEKVLHTEGTAKAKIQS